MKQKYIFPVVLMMVAKANIYAQETKRDSLQAIEGEVLEEIIVKAIRADKNTPVAFSNMNKKELEKRNLGQDIPVLMNVLPSVVTTTDAGNGVGYTGIRVRGSDATRVNVTLNGIAYNDSESHGTFWVNMPDFVSSVQNLQLQRGVGTSTNGAGAFGASLNLLTDSFSYDPYAEISNSFGSFNTRKHTLKFSTGLLNNSIEIQGRISKLNSDGYIDRAWADMSSYFLQGTFINKGTLIKALTFGGKQQTYQAWNGVTADEIKENGRTYNSGGRYKDDNGEVKFYPNETDNYWQDHYQLHWSEKWSSNWRTNFALHYTKGFGYYENYKRNRKLADYGITGLLLEGETVLRSDLIQRKYLDNDFYGFTSSAQYTTSDLELVVGAAANQYKGDHFGEVLWVKNPAIQNYQQQYYFDSSTKNDMNTFVKATWFINNFAFYGDLQYRKVTYTANGEETGNVNDVFNFFNPKVGATYTIDKTQQVYASFARANREPNRSDYKDGNPRPERLNDFEWGYRFENQKNQMFNVNMYYMRYKDQLVLTGALNDVGTPIRENSGDSYRVGVEIEAYIPISSHWRFAPNIALSDNRNIDYKAEIDGKIKHLGNTPIAFSPNIIAGGSIVYHLKDLQITWMPKFVGKQYMSNTKAPDSVLKEYYTNDLVFNYSWKPTKYVKQVDFSLMLNNILNTEYISNGYYYTYNDSNDSGGVTTVGVAGYYPQAKFNFLAGVSLKF